VNTKAPTPPPDDKTARPSAPPPPPPRRGYGGSPTVSKPSSLPSPPPRTAPGDLPADMIFRLADDIANALSVGGRAYPNRLRHINTSDARAIILDTLLKFKP
jgi:hypothetical protein